MPRPRNDQRRPDAHDLRRLTQDRFDAPRVEVAGELERARRRLELVEPHDTPFRLGNDLLCEHDDVVVLELDGRRDERGDVVAVLDLRNPFERDDPQLSQYR